MVKAGQEEADTATAVREKAIKAERVHKECLIKNVRVFNGADYANYLRNGI
jgi:hypothetical protein